MLGPAEGAPRAFWKALFAETYRTEFRVEKKGREDQILAFDPNRFDALLPAAWETGGIGFDVGDGGLKPRLAPDRAHAPRRAWKERRRMGDRKSGGWGKGVAVRVGAVGRRTIKHKNKE